MQEPFAAGCHLRGLYGAGPRQLCVSVTHIKMKKMAVIHKALDECSAEHPVFYEDEVDIHLILKSVRTGSCADSRNWL
jgi:hypothetical protein